MPHRPGSPLDPPLDPRTASLGREWFAQVRRTEREEAAAEAAADTARRRARRDGGTDGGSDTGSWDWLFGDAGDDD